MKKSLLFLCVVTISLSASAQFAGLPVADSAVSPVAGETRVSAGAVLGDNFNLYGGRLSFAPIGRLSFFADLGAIDPDFGDIGLAAQLGGKFTLPLKDSPVDIALRASWSYAAFDLDGGGDTSANALTGGALVSREVGLFSPYVFIGLNFTNQEDKGPDFRATSDDTDLAFAIGAILNLTREFSFYGEFAYVDDPFFGLGGRWTF